MGFWSKFGKIASIAAPIIAAPFTGGLSLAAIGAISGAAGAKLRGAGLKGTLLGAGMGAIPGLSGGGRMAGATIPGLRQGLSQAGRSALGLPSGANANFMGPIQASGGGGASNLLKRSMSLLGDGRLGDIGTTASGAAQGSAEQRRQEADALTRRYAQSLQGARDQSSADLDAALFTRGEDSRAFERALIANQMERGPLTMGAQTPGAFTPTAPSSQNAPGAANAALLAQLAPLQRIDAPTYTPPMAPGVNAQGIPLDLVQGRGEKFLGGLGLTSKLLSSALGGSGTGAPTPDGLPASFDQAPASPDWKSITGWDGTENIPLPPFMELPNITGTPVTQEYNTPPAPSSPVDREDAPKKTTPALPPGSQELTRYEQGLVGVGDPATSRSRGLLGPIRPLEAPTPPGGSLVRTGPPGRGPVVFTPSTEPPPTPTGTYRPGRGRIRDSSQDRPPYVAPAATTPRPEAPRTESAPSTASMWPLAAGVASSQTPVITKILSRITPEFIATAPESYLLAERERINSTLGLIRRSNSFPNMSDPTNPVLGLLRALDAVNNRIQELGVR